MWISIKRLLPLFGLIAFSTNSQAELVSFDSGPLVFTYDLDNLINMGSPEISGTQLVFRPSLGVHAPGDQISYYDSRNYLAIIDVRAKTGFRLDGYSITASGGSYVGDDAIMSISGSFYTAFYGASYYSGALTGTGSWSATGSSTTSLPTITIAGDVSVGTQNHYSYENLVGYEPVYDYNYFDYLIGYSPIFDEEGNQIGETPIYETRYEQYVTGYNPLYETVYQTSSGDFWVDTVNIDFQVTAVPLPPAGLLFLGSLGLAGVFRRALRIKSTVCG